MATTEEGTGPRSDEASVSLLELGLNIPAIAALVGLASVAQHYFSGAFAKLGLDWFMTAFSGQGGAADIAWEVAATRGWLDGAHSAYDPLTTLGPLIGLNWAQDQAHSHPPFGIPLYAPLAPWDYQVWLPWWMAAMICALALSMRFMRVPPHLAYPIALAIAATMPGRWALESSYPLAPSSWPSRGTSAADRSWAASPSACSRPCEARA